MAYAVFPRKLEEKLGEEETRLLIEWLEEFLREKGVTKDEYREILSRLDILENTVEGLKSEFKEFKSEINDLRKEMNERFDKMNERFDKMNERFDKMNERFDKMNERFDQMYERMTSLIKWTIGTLALFGTLITIILAIGQFLR